MTIGSVSANTVTFTASLAHKHRGVATDGNDALIGEISLLSGDIHLHGQANQPEGYGMRILGGSFAMRKYGSDKAALYNGQMNFENIEIESYGQMQYYTIEDPRWGIVFKNGQANNGEDKSVTEARWPACFDIEGAGNGTANSFNNNRASGPGPIGIKHFAHGCDQSDDTHFKNNIARGCMIGYHYRNNLADSANECKIITGLHTANSAGFNMMISALSPESVKVKDCIMSNGQVSNNQMVIMGPSTASHGHNNDLNEILWENCKFVGLSSDFDCDNEIHFGSTDPTYKIASISSMIPKSGVQFPGIKIAVGIAADDLQTPDMPKSWYFPVMGFPTAIFIPGNCTPDFGIIELIDAILYVGSVDPK
jgi:hypothetical protein